MSVYSPLKLFIISLVVFFVLTITPIKADEIVLAADEWCPYNCKPDSDRPGYMVEIAKLALERAGHKVTYITVPWSRALKRVRSGHIDGIIGVMKEEAPDLIYPQTDLGQSDDALLVRHDETWSYKGISSLHKIRLGGVLDYEYEKKLMPYIRGNKNDTSRVYLHGGEKPIPQLINLVLKKRLDAVIGDKNVLLKHVGSMKIGNQIRFEAIHGTYDPVFIAFSPVKQGSIIYADLLQKGLTEMRRSGELQKILDRYNLQDWQTAR